MHVEELEIGARDTKLGAGGDYPRHPQCSEYMLRDLDPDGIVRIGAYVQPGSVLVGKITPKGETELAPERASSARYSARRPADVRDTSLKAPSGTYGIVMDVKVTPYKDLD